jgi:chromosome segregation ATPase
MAPKTAPKAAVKTRPRSSVGAAENIKKRPASVSEDSHDKKKCKSIISALVSVEELSPQVRETLSSLVRHSFGVDNGLPPQYMHAAIALVREALVSTEKRLEEELREARKKVDGAQDDKVAREAAVVDAEAHLTRLKNTIIESKTAIKESSTSIGTSRKSLKVLQGAQKSSQEKLNTIASKVDKLHQVEKDAYLPLKESAALGRKGQEHLKCIGKLGKDFGFQEALLESVPGVLKRSLDRRRTFDGFVMTQLEREFMKHYTEMEGKLKESDEELRKHTHAVQEAQALLDESGHCLEESNQRLTEALVAVSPCKKTVVHARQHVRKFEFDLHKYVRDLDLAQARLFAFRSGPLDAFQELQKRFYDLRPEPCDEKRVAMSSNLTDNASSLLHNTLEQPSTSQKLVSIPGSCDEVRAALPNQTDNVSSLCSTIAPPSILQHDVSVSLATTCPWEASETSLR